jgi:phospholipid/cholesterol/gamma-HCH transport system substrate-binding protein
METRANYAIIGVFTLAVIAAAFGFVFWFSGSDSSQKRQAIRVVFSGSVAGLAKGSSVQFNGIRVGEVTEVHLLPEDPRRVEAVIEVDKSTPIRSDTRARLEAALLTGVTTISLVGGDPSAPPLTSPPGKQTPTIFADRSDFQDLLESARNIARRADEVLERVGKVVTDNEGGIGRTISNLERFSVALGNNAPGIDRFLEQVGTAAERVGPLAEKLEALATDAQTLLRSVDGQRVARSVENVESFTQTLADNRDNVASTFRDVASLAQRLNDTAGKLDATLGDLSNLVKAVDVTKVNNTFTNVESFSRTLADNREALGAIIRDVGELTKAIDPAKLGNTIANVEGFSQTLADNRENVSVVMQDVVALGRRLNESAGKFDATLADVSNVVRAVDTAKLNSTLANVESFSKTLADNREAVNAIIRDVGDLARSIDATKLSNTLANVEGFSKTLADGRENVSSIMEDVAMLSRRLNETMAPKLDAALTEVGNLAKAIDAAKVNRTLENADKFAQALGNSSQDVELAIKEAREIAEKLNKSADRVDGVLKAAEGFLGTASGQEGRGTFEEVREAARSIRELAENLDRRTSEISSGLTRFTNTGLREYEALATEGRKTLNDLSRTVRSLERNPSQVIFGGRPNIPEYNARR